MNKEQQEKVLQLYNQGLPKTKIAQIMGCSTPTILRNLRQMGSDKKIDPMIGQKFGQLTVIKQAQKQNNLVNRCIYYVCQCECGNTVEVNGSALRSGHTKSCGCLRAKNLPYRDLTNLRFGKLTVLELLGSNKGRKVWRCICDCGNEVSAISRDLVKGSKRSCGCLKSWSEQYIKEWLDQHNIVYKREYSFNDLRGKRNPLRFDFALFKNEQLFCLIEYQGMQHFDENSSWHSDSLVLSDQKKKEYCMNNNIVLYELTKDNLIEKLERIYDKYVN